MVVICDSHRPIRGYSVVGDVKPGEVGKIARNNTRSPIPQIRFLCVQLVNSVEAQLYNGQVPHFPEDGEETFVGYLVVAVQIYLDELFGGCQQLHTGIGDPALLFVTLPLPIRTLLREEHSAMMPHRRSPELHSLSDKVCS